MGLFKKRPARRGSRLFRAVVVMAAAFILLPYALVVLYRFANPVSTLMAWRWLNGQRVERTFVPLPQMAPTLPLT